MKKNVLKNFISTLLVSTLMLGSFSSNAYAKSHNKDFEGKVSIGDFGLYTKIVGEGKVSVVFDSGYGDGINTGEDATKGWGEIQQEISKYARTVTYDRAGLGKSDDTGNREPLNEIDRQLLLNNDFAAVPYDKSIFKKGTGKTAIDKARNLHALLKAKHVKAPYLLVAHSIGSLDVVEFTKLYPKEVAGIIMVDCSGKTVMGDMLNFINSYMPEMKDMFLGQFGKADGTIDEVLQSEQQVYQAGDVLRNVPLTYLSAVDEGMGPIYQEVVNAEQEEWLRSSNYSKRIPVPNCGHYVYLDQPQYVIDAIKDMINTIK
jgi:pimeloyl-ACP methyl ester carboxylesterase